MAKDVESECDGRVACLVMNAVPGVATFSSCGGHENRRLGHAGPDEFYVSFSVESSKHGWRALELIAWASAESPIGETQLTACAKPELPGCVNLAFELRGAGYHPDDLATIVAGTSLFSCSWGAERGRR